MNDIKLKINKYLLALMVIPFFFVNSVPVFADYDYDTYYIDPGSILAYVYWNKMGYNLTNTISNSSNIAVPAVRTDTGNTNDRLVCNASGTSYSCYYLGTSGNTGTFQFETTRAHDITEENISIQGGEIPWLSGSYIHDTRYVTGTRSLAIGDAGRSTYLSFYSSTPPISTSGNYTGSNAVDNRYCKIWTQDGSNGIIVDRIMYQAIGGVYYQTFKFTNPNQGTGSIYITIDFPRFTNDTKVVPVYAGNADDIDDSLKQRIGIPTDTENYLSRVADSVENTNLWVQNIQSQNTTTNQYLNEMRQQSYTTNNYLSSGNSTSQAANNALSSENQELNSTVSQINTIETQYNSDLNDALGDIDLSTDLVQHTGFTNAALWVSAQFNRLVIGTPFELVITFSLITGLALVLIGKVRG